MTPDAEQVIGPQAQRPPRTEAGKRLLKWADELPLHVGNEYAEDVLRDAILAIEAATPTDSLDNEAEWYRKGWEAGHAARLAVEVTVTPADSLDALRTALRVTKPQGRDELRQGYERRLTDAFEAALRTADSLDVERLARALDTWGTSGGWHYKPGEGLRPTAEFAADIAAEYDRLRTGQRSPRNDEPEPRLCGCTADTELAASPVCAVCRHRDHPSSGCTVVLSGSSKPEAEKP